MPLGEDIELYDLEILGGSTVVRTVEGITSAGYTYLSADQTTDFGSPPASFNMKIHQMSGAHGRGTPGPKTIYG